MRWLAVAAFVCLSSDRPPTGTYSELTCVGDGANAVVYLHGMDSESPSPQELDNRRVLVAWAKASGLRIALPRSTRPCPDPRDSICWGWAFGPGEREDVARAIESAAGACFAPDSSYGVLGFSNGGYAITELAARGELAARLPRARWVVTVGASMFEGDVGAPQLALQPPIVMLSGEQDAYNFDPHDRYAARLAEHGARVTSVHFRGDHRLEGAPLADALARAEGR